MKKTLFVCALLLSGTATAQTSSNASANGAGAGAATANPDQMVCRSVRETGSMLGRSRICKTRAQWEADRRDTRQSIDRSQTTRINQGGN
jgi:hypothetical protein